MINTTMPIMQQQQPIPLLMQKSVEATLKLSLPLVTKSDVKVQSTIKPWRLTPPLKKRRVHIAAEPEAIKIAPLKAKKTLIKPKRTIRFSRVIKSRTLKKERTNLTPATHQAMWYSNREYAEIDQESRKNVQAFQQVQGDLARLPASDYCLRGLEMKTSPHIHRLRRLRAAITVRAILDQQDYQRRMVGRGSDLVGESMAMVSRRYSQQAQNRARELGLIDSIEARR